jgi:hypothetical protein
VISSDLYETRDDLHSTLRGCADNVKVNIYMDGYMNSPVTIKSGSGGNQLSIHITKSGSVNYHWDRETWGKHFSNAFDTVKSIARSIVSSVGLFLGRLFGSNRSIERPLYGRLTYPMY